MNELIKINQHSDSPTVNGRDLHEALRINSNYTTWFIRMCEYGFIEGVDYKTCFPNLESEIHGGQNKQNHEITISMAKELCMIQRSELGRKFRQYFIKVEEAWNSPEAVMARALQLANKKLLSVEKEKSVLLETIAIQHQQLVEMKPKATYYDVVLKCKDAVNISVIAKDYGMSAKKMNSLLHDLGVQFKQGYTWLLYQKYASKGYTKTNTNTYRDSSGVEHSKIHTKWTQKGRLFIYDLLKDENILPIIESEDGNE